MLLSEQRDLYFPSRSMDRAKKDLNSLRHGPSPHVYPKPFAKAFLPEENQAW